MLPIYGTPHLEYIIRLLKKHSITDIIFSTGYLHDKIVSYFGDGSNFGVNITYREDGEIPLGTAGAIKNCEDLLDDEPFLVFNGDILTNINLDKLIQSHTEGITIALATVKNATQFGMAVLEENKIIGFIEKPSIEFLVSHINLPRVINAGIYIMDKKVLDLIPKDTFYMVETNTFPLYVGKSKLYGYIEENMYWLDIGTHDRYNTANKDVRYGFFRL
jgi:NDP-sugar pyrophosphorylase family protein